jgi:membrane protein
VFSIAPLLILAVGVGSVVFGEEAARGQVSQQLRLYMGSAAAQGVEGMLEGAKMQGQGWVAIGVGSITLLLGASGVFGQMKDALNTIWEVRAMPGRSVAIFLRDRLLSFGMILVIGFLFLVSLVVTAVLASLSAYTLHRIPVPGGVWGLVNFAISLVVSTGLFSAIFRILPDVRIPWRTVVAGACCTAVLFECGKFGIAFYLGRVGAASAFGAAGSVVLVLLWVYYAAAIFLFGAELTRAYARQTGAPIILGRYAESLTDAALATQGTKRAE